MGSLSWPHKTGNTSEPHCLIVQGWHHIVLILCGWNDSSVSTLLSALCFCPRLTCLPGLTCWWRGRAVRLAAQRQLQGIIQRTGAFLSCHTFLTTRLPRPLWVMFDECSRVAVTTSTVRCQLIAYLVFVFISLARARSEELLRQYRKSIELPQLKPDTFDLHMIREP